MSSRARARAAAAVLLSVTVFAALAPILWPGVSDVDFARARQAPSIAHPFGTDTAGRDLFARTAAGLRVSLLAAAASAVTATAIGATIGAVSAFIGGRTDRALMRFADGVNALPHLLLGLVLVAMFRGNVAAVILSIALTHWVQVARIIRAEVLSLRRRPYVDVAVLAGATRRHILFTHLLPAIAPQALIATVMLLPHAVFHESTLSFLGFGLPPHEPSLGTLLSDARSAMLLNEWWALLFPSAALVVATLAFAALANAARPEAAPLLAHKGNER